MNCHSTKTIHTIGHSTRAIEVFLELLRAHEIQLLIDVRRWPASKRHPHFNREALAAALIVNDIEYLWRGDLGLAITNKLLADARKRALIGSRIAQPSGGFSSPCSHPAPERARKVSSGAPLFTATGAN